MQFEIVFLFLCASFQHIIHITTIPKIPVYPHKGILSNPFCSPPGLSHDSCMLAQWRDSKHTTRMSVCFCEDGFSVHCKLRLNSQISLQTLPSHCTYSTSLTTTENKILRRELNEMVTSRLAFWIAFLVIYSIIQTMQMQICCRTTLPSILLLLVLELYCQTNPSVTFFKIWDHFITY